MIELTLENFEKEVLSSLNPCVVVFKHDNCHLCRGLSVVLRQLVHKYDEQIKFAVVDSLRQEKLTDMFEVGGVPTVFLFIDGDGAEVEYPSSPSPLSGYSEKYLINFLDKVVSNE